MKRLTIAVSLTITFAILRSEGLAIVRPSTLSCSINTISSFPQYQSARQYKSGDAFELSIEESRNTVLMTNKDGALESLRGVRYSGDKIQFFLSNEVANGWDQWSDYVNKFMREYPYTDRSRLIEQMSEWKVMMDYYTIILDRSNLRFKNPQDTINGKCVINKESKKLI